MAWSYWVKECLQSSRCLGIHCWKHNWPPMRPGPGTCLWAAHCALFSDRKFCPYKAVQVLSSYVVIDQVIDRFKMINITLRHCGATLRLYSNNLVWRRVWTTLYSVPICCADFAGGIRFRQSSAPLSRASRSQIPIYVTRGREEGKRRNVRSVLLEKVAWIRWGHAQPIVPYFAVPA